MTQSVTKQSAAKMRFRPDAILVGAVLTVLAVALRAWLPGPGQTSFEVLPDLVSVAGAVLGGLAVLGLVPPRVRLAAGWGGAALLLIGGADGVAFDVVGLVMNAVAAVTGDELPIALAVDAPGMTMRLLSLFSAVLLGRWALGQQRVTRAACRSCGRSDAAPRRRVPRWPGYAACALALGYAAEKVYWGLGGTLGLASDDAFGDVRLWSPGLGDTAVLALVGAVIALALVRSWGERLPAWLLLGGAGIGAVMLVPVGILGTSAALTSPPSAGNTIGLEPWVFLVEYPWFLAWGLTLGVAAVGFHYRTRGPCTTCGRG